MNIDIRPKRFSFEIKDSQTDKTIYGVGDCCFVVLLQIEKDKEDEKKFEIMSWNIYPEDQDNGETLVAKLNTIHQLLKNLNLEAEKSCTFIVPEDFLEAARPLMDYLDGKAKNNKFKT